MQCLDKWVQELQSILDEQKVDIEQEIELLAKVTYQSFKNENLIRK